MNFFAIFFGIFFRRLSLNGNRGKIFFFSFSAYLLPFWLEIIPGRDFLIFWFFFFYFFQNFLARAEYERNLGLNFFFFYLFLGLSHPVLAKNNAGKWLFNFSNFFAIFFGIFFPRSTMNENRDKFFFFSISAYLLPFWLKVIPERDFLIFFIFFTMFFGIFLLWLGTNRIQD